MKQFHQGKKGKTNAQTGKSNLQKCDAKTMPKL